MYYNNILEIIGNTPLVKISTLNSNPKVLMLGKLEFLNPGGSIKDRVGPFMIEQAEKEGKLKKGWTIVETTSGNTGVGLALVAAIKEYKTVFVMPDKISDEKRNLLRAYGAKVVITPTDVSPEDPRSYYKVSDKLASRPGAYKPNQYSNPANPEAHYKTTGPEIWKQTEGKVTHVVISMGTGGTITGIGRYLKEKNHKIKIIGVDPVGSIYLKYFKTGKLPGLFKTYKIFFRRFFNGCLSAVFADENRFSQPYQTVDPDHQAETSIQIHPVGHVFRSLGHRTDQLGFVLHVRQ